MIGCKQYYRMHFKKKGDSSGFMLYLDISRQCSSNQNWYLGYQELFGLGNSIPRQSWHGQVFILQSIKIVKDVEGGASNLRLINSCFTTNSSQIFATYIHIFHKTDVQTVILRCLIGLNCNWVKSYETKHKYFCF